MSLLLLFNGVAVGNVLTAEPGSIVVTGSDLTFRFTGIPASIGEAGGSGVHVAPRRRLRTLKPWRLSPGEIIVSGGSVTFTTRGRDELWLLGLLDLEEAA